MVNVIELVEQLFAQYGYLVLLLGLPLDAIALPIPPGNATLTYTGYLSYKGVLHASLAWILAYFGATSGMTITYWIGYRVGSPVIRTYGKWLFLKPRYLKKTRMSYLKYGNKLLLFAYFLPGLRQFIGYFVGIIRIPFPVFALYAYTGAALWVGFFFGIGYFFANTWEVLLFIIEQYLKYFFIGLFIIFGGFIFVKWSQGRKKVIKP